MDWRQDDLARKSGLSLAAINKIERKIGSPRRFTLDILQKTFEQEGIEFLDGPGVRLMDEIFSMKILNGKDAPLQLLDDIYETLKDTGGEVLLSGIDESVWLDYRKEVLAHQKRLRAKNIGTRALLCHGDMDFLPGLDPPKTYRWISKELFTQLLYYVYGDKFALVIWGNPIRIPILHSRVVAETFRRQFEMNWKNGEKVKT